MDEFLPAHGGSASMLSLFVKGGYTMNSHLKMLLIGTAALGLYAPAITFAQQSIGGAVGEARLHPGTWNNQRSSRSYARSRPMYRSTAPVIVRSESAPNSVAQVPTERRSFSYEPSQQAVSGPCGGDTTASAPATVQRSEETRRSYSYEPSMSDTYSAPRMQLRSSQPSRTPRYALPKTDPNKYRN